MRILFIFIIAFDIIILGAGLFFIFDKIRRKFKKSHHLTFHAFEKNGSHGYTLEDDDENSIYYALINGEVDEFAMFKFTNGKTKLSNTHKVSGPGRNSQAQNLTNISFLFDGEDVWSYLRKRSIFIETTIVNENLTLYKINRNSKPFAFVRKKNGLPVYTMKTKEKYLELLFTSLFAIAKTEEFYNVIKEKASADQ